MNQNTDDVARRAYWAEQMELGYELVQRTLTFEVRECGEAFASLPDAATAAGIEMLFSQSKIAGGLDRVFCMRERLVHDVMAVGRAMNERGWILKIEDGYRSLEMQGCLVRKPEVFDAVLRKCIWESGGVMPPVEFVARRALVMVANIPKIGTHMSGSAIDVSVFRRDDGSEVWRGNAYLEMSEITAMLEAQGFIHFPYEFWHFNQGDALGHLVRGLPAPARYGAVHWDAQANRVTPCENPLTPLNPLDAFEREIAAAIQRAQAGG